MYAPLRRDPPPSPRNTFGEQSGPNVTLETTKKLTSNAPGRGPRKLCQNEKGNRIPGPLELLLLHRMYSQITFSYIYQQPQHMSKKHTQHWLEIDKIPFWRRPQTIWGCFFRFSRTSNAMFFCSRPGRIFCAKGSPWSHGTTSKSIFYDFNKTRG